MRLIHIPIDENCAIDAGLPPQLKHGAVKTVLLLLDLSYVLQYMADVIRVDM